MRKIVERRLGCSDVGGAKNAKRAAHLRANVPAGQW
jgi:hypothetical protein